MCVFGDILDVLPDEVRRSLEERPVEEATCDGVSIKQIVNESRVFYCPVSFLLHMSQFSRRLGCWRYTLRSWSFSKLCTGAIRQTKPFSWHHLKQYRPKHLRKYWRKQRSWNDQLVLPTGWQLDGSVNAEGLCAFLHGKSSKFKLTLTRRILRQTYLDSLGCAWRSQIHGCLKNQDQGPRLTES